MTTTQVNVLNIALMAASLAAALALPFELFLLAYAILGPLHYLTEISWLHDRQWFVPGRRDGWPLLACAVLVPLGSAAVLGASGTAALDRAGIGAWLADHTTELTFLAFGIALLFVLTRDLRLRLGGALLLLAGAAWMRVPPGAGMEALVGSLYWTFFAAYLTTLVHVFVFTGLFILWGALKARSASGYLSLAVFLACAAAPFLLPATPYDASPWARASYGENFVGLSQVLLHDVFRVPLHALGNVDLFSDEASVRLMRFMAFAYTYHYLNCFSKTSVIGWQKVSRARLAAVVVLWGASLAVYAWNYAAGLRWLFALSFAHVLLEFPLNHRSFLGIGQELAARLRRPETSRA
ncbi:MAG TPA: hypothetical protein VK824_09910 [Planctomycetota bacterium]|nr:hypothetical protein [Planctomycetota bacterium]